MFLYTYIQIKLLRVPQFHRAYNEVSLLQFWSILWLFYGYPNLISILRLLANFKTDFNKILSKDVFSSKNEIISSTSSTTKQNPFKRRIFLKEWNLVFHLQHYQRRKKAPKNSFWTILKPRGIWDSQWGYRYASQQLSENKFQKWHKRKRGRENQAVLRIRHPRIFCNIGKTPSIPTL